MSTFVKIEISSLSMEEPTEIRSIRSLIGTTFPGEDEGTECRIKVVIPTRTFLEKIFLLAEEFQKNNPRCNRMSRHLYDLEKLMDTEYGKAALADMRLYDDIVEHRRNYYALKYVDYAQHTPSLINFLIPDAVKDAWIADYDAMRHSFIYGESLAFDELMKRMEELQKRIRNLK